MSLKRTLKLLTVLFIAAMVAHYALFGSLPFGKPAMVGDDA